MKVIIAGSRTIEDYELLEYVIKQSGFNITEIVSGGASGVDTLAERYAKENNIIFTKFAAPWNLYGKAAGPIRNRIMAEYADALIAIWDGESSGTRNMIHEAILRGKRVYRYILYTI